MNVEVKFNAKENAALVARRLAVVQPINYHWFSKTAVCNSISIMIIKASSDTYLFVQKKKGIKNRERKTDRQKGLEFVIGSGDKALVRQEVHMGAFPSSQSCSRLAADKTIMMLQRRVAFLREIVSHEI